MPFKTFVQGWAICLAMDRPRDDGRIVIQRANEWMFIQKRQRLLQVAWPLQQAANRP